MKNYIHIHRWSNHLQEYQYVGHLLYENELTGGAVSFFYDQNYLEAGGPSLDPRNLSVDKNGGRHVVTDGNGVLPLYFQQFLPGAYGQLMLKNEFFQFDKLNQFQKLSICAELFGDHIAIQINAQNAQSNLGATTQAELSSITNAIHSARPGQIKAPLGSEKLTATCSLPGHRSKIDYTSSKDGQRYILKPNASSHFNESKVRQFIHSLEVAAGIDSAPIEMLTLDDGDIEVALQKNFKQHFEVNADIPLLLKFNYVGFDVLHGDNSVLSPSQAFSYKDAAAIIDRYSTSPIEDKEQLLLRALLGASINHTSNGLDNLALIDLGSNHWRLAPAFNTMPNPIQEATFSMRYGDHLVSRSHFTVDAAFAKSLALDISLPESAGELALIKVNNALSMRKSLFEKAHVDPQTQSAIEQAIEPQTKVRLYAKPDIDSGHSPGMG